MSMYSKPSDDDDPDLAISVTKTLIFASSESWSGETLQRVKNKTNFKMLQGA